MITDLLSVPRGDRQIGPLHWRRNSFSTAGKSVGAHVHKFDHVTFVMKGRASVEVDGKKFELSSGKAMNIPAGAKHSMRAIEDNTEVFCVFAATDIEDTY